MHDKNKDIKSFTGNTFKWVLFLKYYQELYLEPNQKSMLELFCKNS